MKDVAEGGQVGDGIRGTPMLKLMLRAEGQGSNPCTRLGTVCQGRLKVAETQAEEN